MIGRAPEDFRVSERCMRVPKRVGAIVTIPGTEVGVQNAVASKGKGILAMDESNGTCGKRLDAIGVENTEDNRRSYRELLVTTPGLGDYISGAILFEETLYQSCSTGKTMVDELNGQGICAGIKVRSHSRQSET